MDGTRFDGWTRRRFGLAAGGMIVASGWPEVANQAAARKGKHCKGKKKRCGKKCIDKKACCGGCGQGTCCDGRCVDLGSDVAHCGVCGNGCRSGVCLHGVCTCKNFFSDGPPGSPCSCGARKEGGLRSVMP